MLFKSLSTSNDLVEIDLYLICSDNAIQCLIKKHLIYKYASRNYLKTLIKAAENLK